jgi:aromatic ring-cleaving dioxygenase
MSTSYSPQVRGFHAHVYFDASTLEQARSLCLEATIKFKVAMGRMHEKPVGPHPDWSCQLAFSQATFGEFVPWLALHRDGLVILLHPITGNDLVDHRDRAMWMGAIRPLNLSVLSGSDITYDIPDN